MEIKVCTNCGIEQDKELFPGSGKRDKSKKREICKICWNTYIRERYSKNSYQDTRKIYREKNKEQLNNYYNNYRKNRKSKDELFKLKCNLRTLISNCFRDKNISKKSKVYNILGCDFIFFKSYIEAQFTNSMSWNNIHLDHIKPISTATTEEDVIILNHYTNFQPLLAVDNLVKYNKLIEKQLRLL